MQLIKLTLTGSLALAFASCESLNEPLETGGFDPLGTPGAGTARLAQAKPSGPQFTPGSFVTTSVPQAAFFSTFPSGNATASKLLDRGESVKVISQRGSYVKAELDDGSVGFIPSIVLTDVSENAVPVAGSGAIPLVQPTLGDPPPPLLEDPGAPEDLPPILPDLGPGTPVAPLPDPAAADIPPISPAPIDAPGDAIPVVPPKAATPAEDDPDVPPPLPAPAE